MGAVSVDTDRVTAKGRDGVLELTIGKQAKESATAPDQGSGLGAFAG
jgi:HSP20 family molecular chaperone IbpA